MAVKSRPFSYLNPNAPLFVPAAFLEAEDFSPEWWRLVHTCPAFREYWLRDRYDCGNDGEDVALDDVDELDAVDDLLDLQADLAEMDQAEETIRSALEEGITGQILKNVLPRSTNLYHLHTNIHTFIYIHMHTYTHIHTCQAYIHVYVCVCVCVCVCLVALSGVK